MELMMYLGNDLIESISVNDRDLSVPGYLGRYKRQLKQKYVDLIAQAGQQPEYLVIPVHPRAQVSQNASS
ncbi:MAG TPA: hypothetical protein VM843_03670 [Flavisolibacter sp.]|nr:hypothetical protein [Flavisolibacter sp.]